MREQIISFPSKGLTLEVVAVPLETVGGQCSSAGIVANKKQRSLADASLDLLSNVKNTRTFESWDSSSTLPAFACKRAKTSLQFCFNNRLIGLAAAHQTGQCHAHVGIRATRISSGLDDIMRRFPAASSPPPLLPVPTLTNVRSRLAQ